MNHGERLIAALSHRQPDRVPIDIGGTVNSSIVVEGYAKLKQHYGINSDDVLCNRMMRVVKVDEQILQALDIDTRGVFMGAPIKGADQELEPDGYRDLWGIERVKPPQSYYYDLINSPLSGEISLDDIRKYPWPDPDDPGVLQGIKERIDWIRKHTDCAAVLAVPPPFIHNSQYLRGFEDWYCDIALGAKVFDALCDAVLEVSLEMSKKILEAVGKEVDVVVVGDDIGAQDGLQISPEHYVKYVKPRHAKYFRQVHDLSGAKLLYHTCGSVVDIIEDLVDIDVDAIHPVQVSAAGMEPALLKKKFGDRMAFWGGVDTQKILPSGSVAEVKHAVERCIEEMGEGGGYVLGSVHNLQPDVPIENILAMFEHAREYVPSFAK
jgi:uroporphyrinogen decarboxylase